MRYPWVVPGRGPSRGTFPSTTHLSLPAPLLEVPEHVGHIIRKRQCFFMAEPLVEAKPFIMAEPPFEVPGHLGNFIAKDAHVMSH